MGHMIKTYEALQDILEGEMKAIAKKGDIDEKSLDNLYKLTESQKAIAKMCEYEKMNEEGKSMGMNSNNSYGMNSNNSYRMPMWNAYDGQSMDGRSYDGRSMDGMSGNYSMDGRMGRDADSDGRYSERRGRDARGRYTSRDDGNSYGESYENKGRTYEVRGSYGSYDMSRDASKKKMVQKLSTLMDDTMSEKERQAIQECIDKIER